MLQDEFEWIKSITPNTSHQKELVMGIGDDAALWSVNNELDQVICVDTMVEGVHFIRDTLSPHQLGYKALAVNLSDLGAMGAIPQFYLVSIAISKDWNAVELNEIYKGMTELAARYKTDLIGGDTVSIKGPLVLTVTVIGKVEKGKRLLRSNAKPGDSVFLTGVTGESAAGLKLLLENTRHHSYSKNEKELILQHQMPAPHIEQGRLLASCSHRISLNDVSDGLASELNEIAESSQVSIHIEENKIPVSSRLASYPRNKQLDFQLYGGEDYVLTGTVAQDQFGSLREQFEQHSLKIFEIGKVGEAGKAAVYLHRDENESPEKITKQGFNHFRER
ncbi:thiamine-phosphate kinase [Fictibacillus phosphorivorans]|uniref:thiamine-phosphate kinase n=1 Tax=Fictibacillus phosphorivorans TaxID=1221500 RepID=UPI00203EF36C|nr:thiamine-phosphate kinase [Fictibacillus phosphorivorans]MCM3719844.1 thiamine-phosphate kinase [Fictibacillus phosphorivorans]MCM3777486.1 thiamine-phosphate kinase [Fictibacillus phosphorivorans]